MRAKLLLAEKANAHKNLFITELELKHRVFEVAPAACPA
jgi:hypothetical protein